MDIENRIGELRLDDNEARPKSRKDDQFPVGMRVLVVDDDRTCLLDLKAMLLYCHYHVTSSSNPDEALRLLIESKDKFDLVMTAVDMSPIDGFRFLKLVHSVDKDLPVILYSASEDTKLVMQGISNGACDYLLKPVRVEQLKLIWQHVFKIRRKINVDSPKNVSAATSCCCASPIIPLSTKRSRIQYCNDRLYYEASADAYAKYSSSCLPMVDDRSLRSYGSLNRFISSQDVLLSLMQDKSFVCQLQKSMRYRSGSALSQYKKSSLSQFRRDSFPQSKVPNRISNP